MPELTHDTAEDGFHEIQLSGKQLVFLFMATTVVLVVTFLCGVLVGRGVEAERIGEQAAETATVPEASPEAAAVPPPATDAPTANPQQFTYGERLAAKVPSEQPIEKKPEAQPEPSPAAPPQAAAAAPPVQQAPPNEEANVPTSGRPGTWFLQVSALKNRGAAADIVRSLVAKGYPAYLENPAAGTSPLYRVRIGRYRNRDEAQQVAERLQKEEQFKSDIRR